jgi:hypothetical protein
MRKSIPFFCAVLLWAGVSFAQSSIGPVVGTNITRILSGGKLITADETVVNFRIGALLNAPLSEKWCLQPALLFVNNSEKTVVPMFNSAVSFFLNSVEVPISLTYKIPGPKNSNFYVGVAPFFMVHISARTSNYATNINWIVLGSTGNEIPFGGKYPALKRFGGGAGVNVGYDFGSDWTLRLFGQKLMTDMYVKPGTGRSITLFNCGLTVTYQFPLVRRV